MDTQPPNRKALLQQVRPLKEWAAKWSVSKGHLSRVVAGERRSPRLEREIAGAIRMPLRAAFPEHYSERAA